MAFAIDTASVEAYAFTVMTAPKAQACLGRARNEVLEGHKLQAPRATPNGEELVAACSGSTPGTVRGRERARWRGRERMGGMCAAHRGIIKSPSVAQHPHKNKQPPPQKH